MTKWIKITLLILTAFSPLAVFAQAGQYRGHMMTEQILSERLLGQRSGIALSKYLSSMSGNALFSILDLLGTYRTNNGQHEFRNGQPNSVNMLLWYLVMSGLAKEVQSACVMDNGVPYTQAFRDTLLKICAWPSPEAQEEAVMQEFWLSLMGYDAPESEYQAWREFFLNSSYATRPATETVSALVLSILYNPHFLLRK